MSSFMSSLASLYKRVSIPPVPWRERMGKKGVPVRMNSEKKKNPSRVAIKTASRQIKKAKKSDELEFKLLLLLASFLYVKT